MFKYILTLLFGILVSDLVAQVPQYSQYYANALYLSPSFAGADYSTRGIFASRYQWPGINASYISHTASLDHYLPEHKSGVGLIVNHDMISPSRLRTTDIGLAYSYEVDITRKLTFRPGIQSSFVNRRIDFGNMSFGSQFTDDGYVGGGQDEDLLSPSTSYLDFATGGLLISDKYWFGVAAHHINRPNQSFIHGESRLPAKLSLFGGYKFILSSDYRKRYVNPDEEISISPTFMYKSQGTSDQLDLGLYGRYNTLVVGMWYRGIPIKTYKPDRFNHDAIVLMLGIIYKNINIGYSFDFTTSKLTLETWGSHELTINYRFQEIKKKKPIQKRPACPKF